jgi:transposase
MQEGFWVKKKEFSEYGVIDDFLNGRLTRAEAAKALGVTEKTITNKANKVRKNGLLGLTHGNRGRTPSNKTSALKRRAIVETKKREFFDCNIVHTGELLAERTAIGSVPYSTLRRILVEEGLTKTRQRRRKTARQLRDRFSQEGYFLQIDGSHHVWFGEDKCTLMAAIDDATGKIVSAFFTPEETTLSALQLLKSTVEHHGRPRFFYSDQAGAFGASAKEADNSAFLRACEELGVVVEYAHSPEAKGRVERLFRTLQDRLVPEFRLADVKTMSEATRYINEMFIPKTWDAQFVCTPVDPTPAWRPLAPEQDIRQIASIRSSRKIGKCSTVSIEGVTYVLHARSGEPALQARHAEVREYPDGQWAVFVEGRTVLVQVAPATAQGNPNFRERVKKGNSDLNESPRPLRKVG